jgi:hypothetical protein
MISGQALAGALVGFVGTVVSSALALDWHRLTTRLRDYTFNRARSQPRLLRGSYDAPVSAYRVIFAMMAAISLLLLASSLVSAAHAG